MLYFQVKNTEKGQNRFLFKVMREDFPLEFLVLGATSQDQQLFMSPREIKILLESCSSTSCCYCLFCDLVLYILLHQSVTSTVFCLFVCLFLFSCHSTCILVSIVGVSLMTVVCIFLIQDNIH